MIKKSICYSAYILKKLVPTVKIISNICNQLSRGGVLCGQKRYKTGKLVTKTSGWIITVKNMSCSILSSSEAAQEIST